MERRKLITTVFAALTVLSSSLLRAQGDRRAAPPAQPPVPVLQHALPGHRGDHIGGAEDHVGIHGAAPPDTLSKDQWLQGSYLMAALLRRLESVYIQKRLGSLSEEGWRSRQALFIGIARSPGYSAYLESPSAPLLGDELRDYMDQLASEE